MAAQTKIIAAVTEAHFTLNGVDIVKSTPLTDYERILGPRSRQVDPQPPAPHGHRNNQIHLWDDLGIYVNEHHAARLLEAVTFVFHPSESLFPIAHGFGGKLTAAEIELDAALTERAIDRSVFDHHLAGEYETRIGPFGVYLSLIRLKDRFGKRRDPRVLGTVSICF